MNLIGVDENTRRLLASSDDSNSDVSKKDHSHNSYSKNGSSSEKSDSSSRVIANSSQSETLPRQNRSATSQKVTSEESNIPGSHKSMDQQLN